MRQGQRLHDRYRLDERIAAGGMGEVWRGHDERLNRTVAVKVLHHALASDVVFQHRFHIEARAIAALHHPGIVNIYDFGEETGPEGQLVYLVMEYVPGRSLQQVLNEDGVMDVDVTLRMVAATAEALAVAHRAEIIHRDVKPGNILIGPSGAPRLVDFGIARTAGAASLTNTGMVMGTTAYVAPEQLRGDDPTPANDVYSLGVVAYQCLSGRKPFEGDLPAAVIANVLHSPPPPLPDEIPAAVSAVVMRALAKDPAERWADATEFAAACRAPETAPVTPVVDSTTVTPVPGPVPAADEDLTPPPGTAASGAPSQPLTPVEAPPKRRTGLLVAVIVVLLALLLSIGGYLVYLRPWDRNDIADVGGSAKVQESSESSSPSQESSSPEPEPTSEAEPTSESKSPEPTSAELPFVDGLSEDEAYLMLQESGFEYITTVTDGDGAKVCSVDSQDPPGGEVVEYETEVTVYVQYVDDLMDCRYVGSA